MSKFVSVSERYDVMYFASKKAVCDHFGEMKWWFTRVEVMAEDETHDLSEPEQMTPKTLYQRLGTGEDVLLSLRGYDEAWDYKIVCITK